MKVYFYGLIVVCILTACAAPPQEPLSPTAVTAPLPTATHSPEATATAEITAVVLQDSPIYHGTSAQADTLGHVSAGQMVVVYGLSSDLNWVYISLDTYGWLPASVVQLAGGISQTRLPIIPVANTAPPGLPATDIAGTITAVELSPLTAVPLAYPPLPPPFLPLPQTTPNSAQEECSCASNRYNCGHFATHDEAQACFNRCMILVGKDVYELDGDNDGLACESLP